MFNVILRFKCILTKFVVKPGRLNGAKAVQGSPQMFHDPKATRRIQRETAHVAYAQFVVPLACVCVCVSMRSQKN